MSSNGNIFRVAGPLWGESTGRRWFPITKALSVTRSFDVFFDLRPNKRISKQSWRRNERDGFSNHRRLNCLLSRLFSATQRKHQSSALLACVRNPPVTGGFPSQRASNVENVSIWWRHYEARATLLIPNPSHPFQEQNLFIERQITSRELTIKNLFCTPSMDVIWCLLIAWENCVSV